MSDEPTWSALPVRATAPSTPAARGAAIARLAAWARERGARFDGLELGVDATGNSTTHARRAFARGEPIVTIPRPLILSGDDRDALARWLALEVGREGSPWRAFLDVLPVRFPDLPIFRGGDDLVPLAGTAARLLGAEAHRGIVDAHAALVAESGEPLSLADYAWGRAVLRSRGFNAPYTTEREIALIPIVDLMDHAAGETTWAYDLARATYVVSAARDLAAGDEVHFDYGAYGNTHLFVEYGFALPDNPHDETVLVLEDEPFLVGADDDRLADVTERCGLDAIAAAAARSLERVDAHAGAAASPPPSFWHAMCALVRRGERRTLERILARVTPAR